MSIAWERAYLAYLDSGLSKAEFYRTRLIEFSSDGCIYKLGYLYTKFSQLSKTIIQNDESVESTDDESSEAMFSSPVSFPKLPQDHRGFRQIRLE